MDLTRVHELENHELLNLQVRMSSNGYLQVLRTILMPEASQLIEQLHSRPVGEDAYEWMLSGIEAKFEDTLRKCGLLDLFARTRSFDGYQKARESCKRAFTKLPALRGCRNVASCRPGTVEFDVEFFFMDFMPWKYETALVEHQGTIADAAGRGDLGFFKRLYDRVKNSADTKDKGAGFYNYVLVTSWLHGFFWLMPDALACRVVLERQKRMFDKARVEGIEPRVPKTSKKLTYSSRATHESQRKRFAQAVKYLGLYQHPERPVIELRIPSSGEANTACYVWKDGWPK